ncbi:AbrB/MazE/SpoVT family DNA-binding domain-containing protein [Pyrobaculum aerophilum]|uniref:AbrB/MazE/SpoVT family DNA-binding domain-containing protein n=1 Tax=Pyrobaculum aerophilum TaxID=13773 RepID=UPI002163834D|nr:AbrB/MazE/SpoVT family DNA-binding domain-containing protein [Pyrobaculum aerophilum]
MASTRYLRRVQKIKTGSYIISLPMEWILKNRLKPHDVLLVFEDPNNNIVIKVPASSCEVVVDTSKYQDPRGLEEIIRYLYMFGVDRIIVQNGNGNTFKKIRELRKDLINYEIEDFTDNKIKIIIKDDIYAVEEKHLKKIWIKYIKLLSDILNGICNYNADEEVREKIDESKRLVRYLQRLISIALKEPERNRLPYPTFAAFFEITIRLREIGYYVYRMVDFLNGVRKREELNKICDICRNALNTSDLATLVKLREELNSYEESILPSLNAYEAHMAFAMRRILFNLVRIAELMIVADETQRVTCVPVAKEEEF